MRALSGARILCGKVDVKKLMRAPIILGAMMVMSPFAFAQEPGREIVAAGAKLYDLNCAPCHGDKLQNPGITYDLKRLKATERPRFENSVLNGKNQMPPWKGVLKDDQIESLWAYIRANANE